jgi:urease accessory protein
MDWLALQIADAAFPAGGFAHSAGLEAAVQLGEVKTEDDVRRFVHAAVWQTGLASVPFVGAAHRAPLEVGRIDAACDAFLLQSVANRASRTQGRAFVATSARVFDVPAVMALDAQVRGKALYGHHAVLFGATLQALGLDWPSTHRLFLHLALRGVTSAAIRLGVTGPHEAQRIQREAAPLLEEVRTASCDLRVDDAAQPAPLLDLFAQLHDRLYSRLFQS